MNVILASKSPRRRELLSEIVDRFEIITRETDETLPDDMHPSEGVGVLAVRKGKAVADIITEDAMIISSDTLVELDGVPLGKPRDRKDAYEMLRSLSGRWHNVHTGVAVHRGDRVWSGVDTTRVRFRQMTDTEIYEYIDTGEPMDKAGAYGIQGLGGRFVAEYDGRYDTVVGLSVTLTRSLMDRAMEET